MHTAQTKEEPLTDPRPPMRPGNRGLYKSEFNQMAFQRGYEGAGEGKPRDANPNAAWRAGWDRYHTDRLDHAAREKS